MTKKGRTKSRRRWLTASMFAVLIVSVVVWYVSLDRVPETIRLAAAAEGGLYYRFGSMVEPSMEERLATNIEIVETKGSVENQRLLASGEVEFAIIQGGAVPMDDFAVVAPLYHEVLHVIVRRGGRPTLQLVRDLAERSVVLGPSGSGMRQSSLSLLDHYRLTASVNDHPQRYFLDLLDDSSLDAAIVTTGVENPDLNKLLRSGRFALVDVDEAPAIELKHPYFVQFEVPLGLYSGEPPIPGRPVQTVATTSFLVTRPETSPKVVRALLACLYEEGLRLEFPTMIPRHLASEVTPVRLHAASRSFFEPADSIGLLANLMESLAATKELLFALAAGIYLLWDRRRRMKERENLRQKRVQKEHLQKFMEETLRIERAQMDTTDVDDLEEFLDDVTRIKLQALEELTHEELRGDQAFAIFLAQCANLINKIQLKIIRYSRDRKPAEELGG